LQTSTNLARCDSQIVGTKNKNKNKNKKNDNVQLRIVTTWLMFSQSTLMSLPRSQRQVEASNGNPSYPPFPPELTQPRPKPSKRVLTDRKESADA
jgi:hypothetical protein